ncbi:hypothetical protein J6590_014245 [Homalodisca vitripennis]|nr:hypothetical protein J6590_014245 [Homalodisca vitripennis]
MTEVRRLTEEGLQQVTTVEWTDIVKHTKKYILEACAQKGLIETAVEEMIIHVNGDDSDSETSNFEDFADEYRVQTDQGTQETYVNRMYADGV